MLKRIRDQLPDLSVSERKVGALVLENPYTVMRATVADIAAWAEVSQPTVIRFTRSMGCSGLSDFKLRLANSPASGVPYVHQSVRPEDPVVEIIPKIFESTHSALAKCCREVDPSQVEQAIALLALAHRIEFYGLGNSGIVATDAQHKFFRFSIPAVAYSDSSIQARAATMLSPGDVVVAISNSGRSIELLEAVQIARAAGASVIAITASGSPLADLASVALIADTYEDSEIYSPMASRIVHLVLIDILAVGVALHHGPSLISRLAKSMHSLHSKRFSKRF